LAEGAESKVHSLYRGREFNVAAVRLVDAGGDEIERKADLIKVHSNGQSVVKVAKVRGIKEQHDLHKMYFWINLDWSELSNLISEQAMYLAYKYPVATNSLMVELSYLQELVKDFYTDIYLSENYHVIRRREKMMSVSGNKVVASESLTFEGDIRDLLACCKDPGLMLVPRNKCFTPVISKNDEYSLESSVDFHQHSLAEEYNSCTVLHQFINLSMKTSKSSI
jgi:hypothetical protein